MIAVSIGIHAPILFLDISRKSLFIYLKQEAGDMQSKKCFCRQTTIHDTPEIWTTRCDHTEHTKYKKLHLLSLSFTETQLVIQMCMELPSRKSLKPKDSIMLRAKVEHDRGETVAPYCVEQQ